MPENKKKRSTAQSGHAVNAANFESIIIILVSLGTAYNPSQKLILLAALQAKLTEVKNAIIAENTAEAEETNDTNSRTAAYANIGKLATKIKLAVEVNVNDDSFNADMLTQTRRIHGGRAGDAPVDDPNTPDIDESLNRHSVSQQSYDDLLATFAVIIAMLKLRPDYTPNEDDVKIATLETRYAEMEAANNQAKASAAAARNARQTRDDLLYDPTGGVLKLVKLIKATIKQNFAPDTPTYKAIMALQFSKSR